MSAKATAPTCTPARTATNRCTQCEVLYINGVRCHETGCPVAWMDSQRECKWCGQHFVPEYKGQVTCDEDCTKAYFT